MGEIPARTAEIADASGNWTQHESVMVDECVRIFAGLDVLRVIGCDS